MFVKAVATLALAASAFAADLMINTPPSLTECQPASLSWSGGTSPYFVAIIPGGQSTAAAIKDFGQQTGTSLTWTVDLASGTSISLKVTDADGNINYSDAKTILAGSDTSCLNSAVSASAASGTAAAGAAGSTGSSMMASAMASSTGAASSASGAVAGAASSAAAGASSAKSAAASGAPAAKSAAASGTSAAGSAASGAASAASSTGAASAFAVAPMTGVVAVVLGALGLAL